MSSDAYIVMIEADHPVVKERVYDLMDELLEADVLMLFRNRIERRGGTRQGWCTGDQTQFGYLPRMALGLLAR